MTPAETLASVPCSARPMARPADARTARRLAVCTYLVENGDNRHGDDGVADEAAEEMHEHFVKTRLFGQRGDKRMAVQKPEFFRRE